VTAFTHDSYFSKSLADADPAIFKGVQGELGRQKEQIELIASENIVSQAVLDAQGSVLTNKYAEGYPGRRYYGGCEFVDITEDLARERAKELFGAAFVNVQPHSGAQANQAVFFSLLQPGDTFLGMDLACGGHLTHGSPANQSGKWFRPVTYKVNEDDHLIDYDHVAEMAQKEKPKLILAGASAYSRHIDFKRFREIADSVGAYLMVDMAHYAGLIAGGAYPDPIPHAHVVTTTTHKTLRGPRGGMILSNDLDLGKKINSAVFPGLQGGPLEHVIAAKAVAFGEALKPEFKLYAQQVVKNAQAMASVFIERGFDVVSGGTQNHLFLLSLIKQEISGKDADAALGKAFITVNKNSVPNDPRSPFVTSGLRFGTPAVTTRGFKEAECKELAGWICDILADLNNEAVIDAVREKVKAICKKLPVYGN